MTKEQLKSYGEIKAEIKQIKEALEELEARIYSPGVGRYDGMPHGGGTGDPMTDGAAKHIELEAKYRAKIAELEAAQLEIETVIEGLTGTERLLMRARYIEGLKWEAVCVKIGYCWQDTHRKHRAILEKIR